MFVEKNRNNADRHGRARLQLIQHAHAESLDLFLFFKPKRVQKVRFEIVIPSSQFVLSYNGISIVDEQTAIHEHYSTSLGVFDGSPFIVGSWDSNKEVEHFKGSWKSLGQFPFVSLWITKYSTVTVKNVLYIFGNFNSYRLLQTTIETIAYSPHFTSAQIISPEL